MLMASYDDGANIGFWDGLRPRRERSLEAGRETAAVREAYVGPADELVAAGREAAPAAMFGQAWSEYQAPKRMVQEVAHQLALIHGLAYTPEVRGRRVSRLG